MSFLCVERKEALGLVDGVPAPVMTSLSHFSASYSPTCSGSKIVTTTPTAAFATHPWPAGRRPASSAMVRHGYPKGIRAASLTGSAGDSANSRTVEFPKPGRPVLHILVLFGYFPDT